MKTIHIGSIHIDEMYIEKKYLCSIYEQTNTGCTNVQIVSQSDIYITMSPIKRDSTTFDNKYCLRPKVNLWAS